MGKITIKNLLKQKSEPPPLHAKWFKSTPQTRAWPWLTTISTLQNGTEN